MKSAIVTGVITIAGMPAAVNAMFTAEMQPADKEQATFMLNTLQQKADEQIDSDADLSDEARAAAKEVEGAMLGKHRN